MNKDKKTKKDKAGWGVINKTVKKHVKKTNGGYESKEKKRGMQ